MTLETVSEVVENRMTSPVWWEVEEEAEEDAWEDGVGVGNGCVVAVDVEPVEREVGEGTGEG